MPYLQSLSGVDRITGMILSWTYFGLLLLSSFYPVGDTFSPYSGGLFSLETVDSPKVRGVQTPFFSGLEIGDYLSDLHITRARSMSTCFSPARHNQSMKYQHWKLHLLKLLASAALFLTRKMV